MMRGCPCPLAPAATRVSVPPSRARSRGAGREARPGHVAASHPAPGRAGGEGARCGGEQGCKGPGEMREMVPTLPESRGMEPGAVGQQQQPLSSGFPPHPAARRGSAGSRRSGGTLVPTSVTCFSPLPFDGSGPAWGWTAQPGAVWALQRRQSLLPAPGGSSREPSLRAHPQPGSSGALTSLLLSPRRAVGAAAAGCEHGGEQVAGFRSVPCP